MVNPKKLDNNVIQEGVILSDALRFGDDRGDFVNLGFEHSFKRSYIISNNHKGIVRAFHGHKQENKLFFVPKGAFKFILMNMETLEYKEYSLLASVPKLLYVPKGYYNGFVSLTDDALLVTFSTSDIESSKKDDFRLPYDFIGKEVWEVNNR